MSERTRTAGIGLLAVVILLAGPLMIPALNQVDAAPLSKLPALPGCPRLEAWKAPWAPAISGADVELKGTYRCNSFTTHVMAAQFIEQYQGKEAVNSNNQPVPRTWIYRGYGVEGLIDGAKVVRVSLGSDKTLTVLYWYSVGGASTSESWQVKARELWNTATFSATDTTLFAVGFESDGEISPDHMQDVVDRLRTWYAARRG